MAKAPIVFILFVIILFNVFEPSFQQNKVHSGNLCTVLCSGAVSTVAKTNTELSSQENSEDQQSLLLDHFMKRQAEMEFIKENLRNNSLELTIIRSFLNELWQQQQQNSTSITNDPRDLRLARSGISALSRQLFPMAVKTELESPEASTEVNKAKDDSMTGNEHVVENENVIKSVPSDCEEVRRALGKYYIGRYYTQIKPAESSEAFLTGCELREDAGWTVIQKRVDGLLSFDRSWDEYKAGFGHVEGEFWLGNNKIHHLTNQREYKLRIELQTGSGRKFHAEYANFRVADESDSYRLIVSGYLGGSAGDALTGILSHNGSLFTTRDKDNDKYDAGNCAIQYHGGWWFHSCFVAFLNGIVPPNSNSPSAPGSFTTRDTSSWHARRVRSFYVPAMMQDGIVWRTINKRQTRDSAYYDDVTIKMAMMMIAPKY